MKRASVKGGSLSIIGAGSGMRYVFLSSDFYKQHQNDSEILKKPLRPYIVLMIKIDGVDFVLPLRSHIKHKFAFITNGESNSGIDYTKAVVLGANDINKQDIPRIRSLEHNALKGKEKLIELGMRRFIKRYKKALLKPKIEINRIILNDSALQYFHKELGISN